MLQKRQQMAGTIEQQRSIDLDNDVHYEPASAWEESSNAPCTSSRLSEKTTHRFTSQPGASASFSFEGDRLSVTGIKSNTSGILHISTDGNQNFTQDLLLPGLSACSLFFDDHITNASHTVTLTLLGRNTTNSTSGPSLLPSELRLLEISYFVIVPSPSASVSPVTSHTTKHTPVSTLVSIIIGSILGTFVLILIVLLIWRRRRKSRSNILQPEAAIRPSSYVATYEGMAEHRTLTTLSYGHSEHLASDQIALLPVSSASSNSRSSRATLQSVTSEPEHSASRPPLYSPDHDLNPPPPYDDLVPTQAVSSVTY
ncbi:unnamed protein product [Somion occarium]|uniref:Uncharacterized protein n=1 Tax=Somion occarium TaxID=3059160 RepID=A0ABP1CUE3_9APHY